MLRWLVSLFLYALVYLVARCLARLALPAAAASVYFPAALCAPFVHGTAVPYFYLRVGDRAKRRSPACCLLYTNMPAGCSVPHFFRVAVSARTGSHLLRRQATAWRQDG